MTTQLWPSAIFTDKDGNVPIRSLYTDPAAAGTTALVAAVSGKQIAVLSFEVISQGAATHVIFASAATLLRFAAAPVNTGAIPNAAVGNPFLFVTATGEALNATIGAVKANISITYIIFTP